MALGIFALDALQRMPGPIRLITRVIAVELVVMWAFIAASYLRSWVAGTIRMHTADPMSSFGIGTWVAGTAVVGEVILFALPGWRSLAELLWLVTLLLWLWFLHVEARGLRAIAFGGAGSRATGSVLLSTVSTQSIAILSVALVPHEMPRWITTVLLVFGALLYLVGAGLIARRYLRQALGHVLDAWDNTNCILHGALSITGLAASVTGGLPNGLVIVLWLCAAGMLLPVEAVDIARGVVRVHRYGWEDGVFTYHVSQWARVFTLGMFYAFTVHLPVRAIRGAPWLEPVQSLLITHGQYVVLAVVLVEVALLVKALAQASRGQRSASQSVAGR